MRIKKAILKYGKENFSIKKLEECVVEKLDEREIYYINLYDSYNKGYNCTRGGKNSSKPLKLKEKQQKECIELYKIGLSLRNIAIEYNVDKATIKHILEINNIKLRTSRTYKLSLEDRISILKDATYLSNKSILKKWNISKSYLSQLLNGKRRI